MTDVNEKPLFIPLKTEWFRKFAAGEKDTEYRAYGPRWNERTCRPGRRAVISHGYGRRERIERQVVAFRKVPWMEASFAAQQIFPNAEYIAAIYLPPAGRWLTD